MDALNTRISLRYDTKENWESASGKAQILLEGEVGICVYTAENATQPYAMFKVGDGQSTFEQLNWSYGLAADVWSWAKEAGIYVESTEGTIITNIAWDNTLNNGKGGILVTKYNPTVEEDEYAVGGLKAAINEETLIFSDADKQKAIKSIVF